MINPWRTLRSLEHIELRWHDDGEMGETDFDGQFITIRRGLTWEERRCTVLHECIHVERGPVPAGLYEREELRVQKLTAERMLPDVVEIAKAYAWSQGDDDGAASELGVDVDVLRTRMRHMSSVADRMFLAKRFEEDGEWCGLG